MSRLSRGVLLFAIALMVIAIADAQTCKVDRILVNGTCQQCPKGLSRPLTISQTGPCILTSAKCYSNGTSVVCAGGCALPCGQTLQCTQLPGLVCGVHKVRVVHDMSVMLTLQLQFFHRQAKFDNDQSIHNE
jgi:hypothetical protein